VQATVLALSAREIKSAPSPQGGRYRTVTTGSAAAQVLSSARALANESSQLKSEVKRFMATVRAA
jgi:hypothetical protein